MDLDLWNSEWVIIINNDKYKAETFQTKDFAKSGVEKL